MAGRGPNLRRELIVNAGLPYAAYLLLSWRGVPTIWALAAGSVFPIVGGIVQFVRDRKISGLAVLVVVGTAAATVASLLFTSTFLALLKGSLITATVALTFLLSLLRKRPLIYLLALAAAEETERAGLEQSWETSPGFRRDLRLITIVWAGGLLVEAGIRVLLIFVLPTAVFLPVSEALWMVAFALLIGWSYWWGKRRPDDSASDATRS